MHIHMTCAGRDILGSVPALMKGGESGQRRPQQAAPLPLWDSVLRCLWEVAGDIGRQTRAVPQPAGLQIGLEEWQSEPAGIWWTQIASMSEVEAWGPPRFQVIMPVCGWSRTQDAQVSSNPDLQITKRASVYMGGWCSALLLCRQL